MKKFAAVTALVAGLALGAQAQDLVHAVGAAGKWFGHGVAVVSKDVAKGTKKAAVKTKDFVYKPKAKRAGDGSPIPTCIPGHPCDDDDKIS